MGTKPKPKTKARKKQGVKSTSVSGLNMSRYEQFDCGDVDGFGNRFVDFRLFVFGVEVTEHCMGTISIPRAGRDGEGTLSFTLDNNYDKFVMRSANYNYPVDWQEHYETETWRESALDLRGGNRDTGSASNFIDPMRAQQDVMGKYLYSEAAKQRIYTRKARINSDMRSSYAKLLGANNSPEFKPLVDSYRMHVGAPIIARMDHVRIWILDPLLDPAEVGSGDPGAPTSTRWMPAFTGFVDVVTKSSDLMTGKQTLEIQCVDIRTILKRKRVLVNSTAADGNLMVNPNASVQGLYADMNLGNLGSTTNDLATLNLREMIAKIFCKSAVLAEEKKYQKTDANQSWAVYKPMKLDLPGVEQSPTDSTRPNLPSQAAAAAQASGSATPGSDTAKAAATAQADQAETSAKFAMATFLTPGHYREIPGVIKALRGDASTNTDVNDAKYGVGLYTLGHYFKFPDMKNVKPRTNQTLDDARREACAKFMDDWCSLTVFGVNRTWYSDADVTRIGSESYPGGQFSCYKGFVHMLEPADGNGISSYMDSTLIGGMGVDREFQSVYQIFTDVCTRVDYQFQVNGMGDIMFEPPFYDMLPSDLGPTWKYLHAVGNTVRSASVNDDSESNPITCLKVVGGLQNINTPDITDDKVKHYEYTIFVKSDAMTTLYGYVEEDRPCPFIAASDSGTGENTQENAKLAIFGIIEYTKLVAAMSQLQVEAAYNPFLYPNRPYLAFYERRAGTISGCTITLEIGQSASSSAELHMVRQFDDTGVCTNLTGFKHTPLSLVNPDDTLDALLKMDGSWADIRTKSGVEIYKMADDGQRLTVVAGKSHGALGGLPKTESVNRELDALLKDHPGLKKQDLLGMMMQESGGSSKAMNVDAPQNSAAGIFQLVRKSYISTRAFALKHGLTWPQGSCQVDVSDAKRYQQTYTSAYTTEQQIQIWNIYIKSVEASTGTPVDSNLKLAMCNFGPAYVKHPETAPPEGLNYAGIIKANAASKAANSWESSVTSGSSQDAESKQKAATTPSPADTATGTAERRVR